MFWTYIVCGVCVHICCIHSIMAGERLSTFNKHSVFQRFRPALHVVYMWPTCGSTCSLNVALHVVYMWPTRGSTCCLLVVYMLSTCGSTCDQNYMWLYMWPKLHVALHVVYMWSTCGSTCGLHVAKTTCGLPGAHLNVVCRALTCMLSDPYLTPLHSFMPVQPTWPEAAHIQHAYPPAALSVVRWRRPSRKHAPQQPQTSAKTLPVTYVHVCMHALLFLRTLLWAKQGIRASVASDI